MKFYTQSILLLGLCLFLPTAFGYQLTWYNDIQVFYPDRITPLQPFCMVHLIADGGKDGVDDPYEWWMSQPDPHQAMMSWIASGCRPVGDDYMIEGAFILDLTQEPGCTPEMCNGWFGELNMQKTIPEYGSGVGLYTRIFSNPYLSMREGDYYGTIGAEELGQSFLMYQLDNAVFPVYCVHGGVTNIQIVVPEPPIISIFFCFFPIFAVYLIRKERKKISMLKFRIMT